MTRKEDAAMKTKYKLNLLAAALAGASVYHLGNFGTCRAKLSALKLTPKAPVLP
jgi:hypothetical protein